MWLALFRTVTRLRLWTSSGTGWRSPRSTNGVARWIASRLRKPRTGRSYAHASLSFRLADSKRVLNHTLEIRQEKAGQRFSHCSASLLGVQVLAIGCQRVKSTSPEESTF